MKNPKTMAVVVLVVLAAMWLSQAAKPTPPERPDRPVVRALVNIARIAARFGLWIALCADDRSSQPQMLHAKIGEDGAPTIDNGACW